MCGIAGFLRADGVGREEAHGVLRAMAGALAHRGPDDAGTWVDPAAGVGLGHRRLAVVDLSPLGHQPMHSPCGRYTLTYNGEIYNFRALAAELGARGHRFRGHSDTEVLLAAVREWGVRGALHRCNGMFAFALWDREERTLHLARDRAGEKPLYYGWAGRVFLFGSELKALRAHPDFRAEVDRDAVALFLRHRSVPAPYSIYQGVRKLPPGTLLSVRAGADPADAHPEPYWSAAEMAERCAGSRFHGSDEEALAGLDELLRDAVRIRMEADVPLGAFLSGGIDSSLVVALMQAQSARPVKTFTIGFREAAYDEAGHARAVARHLGTEHTELYVAPEEALEVIPRLPALYDEPFSDPSQIPTFLVCELARRHVTVTLSGDGGDELFGGYERHRWGRAVWRALRCLPAGARRAAAGALAGVPAERWDALFARLGPLAPRKLGRQSAGTRAAQLAEILPSRTPEEVFLWLVSDWRSGPAAAVPGAHEPPTLLGGGGALSFLPDLRERFMLLDAVSYLPDDILAKVDRASMGVSLEGRMPLLDPRVMELAWRLPPSMKVRGREGKWPLRRLLYRYVPRALVDRPKMGFCAPVSAWLRGPLRPWAEALLDERRLREEGVFDPAPVRARWREHLSGARDRGFDLWSVLMFQAWHEHARERAAPPPRRAEAYALAL